MATQAVASPFPLKVNVPREFVDMEKALREGLKEPPPPAPAGTSFYCDPVDAKTLLEQLRGVDTDASGAGCFVVQRDTSSSYEPESKTFSVEKQVEEMKKWAPSTEPRFDLKILSYAKREIRGLPTLGFVQDVTNHLGRSKVYFLYVARDRELWLVQYTAGKQDQVGASIWEAFMRGL